MVILESSFCVCGVACSDVQFALMPLLKVLFRFSLCLPPAGFFNVLSYYSILSKPSNSFSIHEVVVANHDSDSILDCHEVIDVS